MEELWGPISGTEEGGSVELSRVLIPKDCQSTDAESERAWRPYTSQDCCDADGLQISV